MKLFYKPSACCSANKPEVWTTQLITIVCKLIDYAD
jgi:hypothetical protein